MAMKHLPMAVILTLNNIALEWGEELPEFFTHSIHCIDVKNPEINNFTGIPNPASPESVAIKLENTILK